VEKTLRRHLEDVSDLSWSRDGLNLVSASVDNSAVIWDVKKVNEYLLYLQFRCLT